MTEAKYRAAKAVNKSTLWELRKSPAHYKYRLDHPIADTPAMKLGRAVHCAILRPRMFNKEYALLPDDIDRRTKAGRAEMDKFEAANKGKELITAADMRTISAMKKAVMSSPAAELLKGTKREKDIFWRDPETGMRCKCKMDACKKLDNDTGIIIDLKTCLDASTAAFTRDAIKRGYDVQAAHYIRGFKQKYGLKDVRWWFIVVEKEPPFAVNILKAGDNFIDRGTWQLIDLMDKLRACKQDNRWNAYGVNDLILPAWAEYSNDD